MNSIWPTCQSKLPKNIFNFTIGYINNSLLNRKNLHKWGITSSPECSFCLYPETLPHVVAGCNSYLDRFTWRHDSVLNFIGNNLPLAQIQKIFAELPLFSNPSIITGDDYRPNILIFTKDHILYVLELTVGYESHLRNNINCKYCKYKELIKELKRKFNCIKFINLSVSALGVFDNESAAFIDMLERLDVNNNHVTYHIKKIITIVIRSTYYIFCCRNKEWTIELKRTGTLPPVQTPMIY